MKEINEEKWIMEKAEQEGNPFICAGGFLSAPKDIQNILSTVESYMNLPKGWDYGVGDPASKETVEKAKQIIYVAHFTLGFNDDSIEATPCTDGSIDLSFFNGGIEFLDIHVPFDNKGYEAHRESGIGLVYKTFDLSKDLSLDQVFDKLTEFNKLKIN